MNKQVTVNGKKVKVNFEIVRHEMTLLEATKTEFNRLTRQCSIIINNVEYINCFTINAKQTIKTGNLSKQFICNKTGKTFGDSYVKLVEHLLN